MSERIFRRWHRALVIVSGAMVVFGVVVAVWPFGPMFALRNAALADAFFGGDWGEGPRAYHRFALASLGAIIAGFYVLQTAIAAIPFARRERWAWYAMVSGNAVWFVISSGMVLLTGAALSVWVVAVFPILVLGVIFYATHRALR